MVAMKASWVVLRIVALALVLGGALFYLSNKSTPEPTPVPTVTSTEQVPEIISSDPGIVPSIPGIAPTKAKKAEKKTTLEVNSEGETYIPLPQVAHPEGSDGG